MSKEDAKREFAETLCGSDWDDINTTDWAQWRRLWAALDVYFDYREDDA